MSSSTLIRHYNQPFYSPNGRINLTHIDVSNKSKNSRHCLSGASITSQRSVSGSCLLYEMTSITNVNNLLIDVGSELKPFSTKKESGDFFQKIIKIQSVYRRYAVQRQIALKEKNRKCLRFTVLKEAEEQNGGWKTCTGFKNQHKHIFKSICKEVTYLVNLVKYKNMKEYERYEIFKLLFNCFCQVDKLTVMRYDATLFIKNILKLNIECYELLVILNSMTLHDTITCPKLYNWFCEYKTTNKLSQSLCERLCQHIYNDYPVFFIYSYIANKSSCFDVVITMYNFDKKNQPDFSCPICHKVSIKPMLLAKHIVKCRCVNQRN